MGTRAACLVLACALAAGCSKGRALPEAEPAPADAGAPADPIAALAWKPQPVDWSRPVPAIPPGGLAEEGYVGSEACRGCHQEIYRRYQRHPMARSGLRPLASLDPRWLARIFDGAAPVRHQRSGFDYRPFRRGGRYYVEETLADAQGAPVHRWEQEVTHALSAGSYGLALYFVQGSRLWHVPIDYFARAGRWDLDPFAAGGNPRFFSSLGPFCISCHSDYPRRSGAGEGMFVQPMPAGIGCERCHGPGARHAKTQEAADIVDPGKLSPLRQLDACAQCHVESGSIARAGRDEFSFRPGEALGDYRISFLAEPAHPDQVRLLGHPDRLVRSACWRGSQGKLTCTSCHDPHVPSAEEPASWWDQRCNTCHAQRPCSESAAARAAKQDHCVTCHMGTGPADGVPLATVTDHWIQRRPAALHAGRREPPARLRTWPELIGDPAHGDDLAAVLAAGHSKAGLEAQALAMAAPVLAAGRPRVRQLYLIAAGHLKELGKREAAAAAYAEILQFAPDDQTVLLSYTRSMLDAGKPDEAMRALDRLLAIDPDDSRALELEGMVHLRTGDAAGAAPLLARAAAAAPGAGSARVGLAALALKQGRAADAIAELEAARRIVPEDSWVLDRLAGAYRAHGDGAAAAAVDDARARLTAMGRTPAPTEASRWLPPEWR